MCFGFPLQSPPPPRIASLETHLANAELAAHQARQLRLLTRPKLARLVQPVVEPCPYCAKPANRCGCGFSD